MSGKARDGAADEDLRALLSMPGYLIRRSKQVSTGIFMDACKEMDITPVQFSALSILAARPGIDQTELGEIAGLDSSTIADVIQRLERRVLLERTGQGNRRICVLTPAGEQALARLRPLVARAQSHILAALTVREQKQLLRLLSKLNGVSNNHYTAPAARRHRKRLVGDPA
jgi:DNA-binding MarR family transcriptional regulator